VDHILRMDENELPENIL